MSTITDPRIKESSGLAAGKAVDFGYTTNDENTTPQVFGIKLTTAEVKTTFSLKGYKVKDPEAVGVGPDGKFWLADIGDNEAVRKDCALYWLPEPGPGNHGALPCTKIPVTYSTGPCNAECLLIHPITGEIYVISKEKVGRLFKLNGKVLANQAKNMPSYVTDGDFTNDGKYVFLRRKDKQTVTVLDGKTFKLLGEFNTPAVKQPESLTMDHDNKHFWIGSEGVKSPLIKWNIPDKYLPGKEQIDRMDPKNYGPGHIGEHITWYGERLIVHGFGKHYTSGPGPVWGAADRDNTIDFQKAQGWSGSNADGLPGAETLRRLAADPDTSPTRFDVTSWKLTLPIGSVGKPLEIVQPELNDLQTISRDGFTPYHNLGKSIIFRANHGGVTTSGSKNPRSELREMSKDGSKTVTWSTASGTHNFNATLAVNKLTFVKNHVVISQIHGPDDDLTVFRLEGTNLWVTSGDTTHGHLVTNNFQLGVPVNLGFIVGGGKVKFSYNGALLDYEVLSSAAGNYFKVGCYLQSNPSTAPSEKPEAYAEVELFGVTVKHS